MTNEIATAGPAVVLATTPVSTKMPVPMITPTPKTVRSSAGQVPPELVFGLVGVADGVLDRLDPASASSHGVLLGRRRTPAPVVVPGSVARVPSAACLR